MFNNYHWSSRIKWNKCNKQTSQAARRDQLWQQGVISYGVEHRLGNLDAQMKGLENWLALHTWSVEMVVLLPASPSSYSVTFDFEFHLWWPRDTPFPRLFCWVWPCEYPLPIDGVGSSFPLLLILLSSLYAPLLHGRVTVQRPETEDGRTTSSWGLERSWVPVLTSTLPDWMLSLDNYRWEKMSFILVSLWLPKHLSYSSLMRHSCTET